MMAAYVHAQELDSKLSPLRTDVCQLGFKDVRTPASQFKTGMTSDGHLSNGQSASLEHLLAHLENSKQALEHQVQQLLQENRLSKSGKKDNQWQMERERLLSDLDTSNLALVEKEERIYQLEKELRDTKNTVEQVQSRCREAEREKERGVLERANMQADLEDAQIAIQNLERECKLKQDIYEKQRRALDNLTEKVETQREIFQNHLEEAKRRVLKVEERDQKYQVAAQVATQKLSEKERQLTSLREAHEKLLVVHKSKQAEERQGVEEVIHALEASQAKCGEQKRLLKEMEQELGKVKNEAHQLEVRLSAAEAEARAKASTLEQVQSELVSSAARAVSGTKAMAQAEEMKSQIDALNRDLKEVETTLSEENALRFKAECALNEYKQREKCFLKVEQGCKALQEEAKWRNEQFQSLEEAHSRLRDQFQECRNIWATEKTAMVSDIELLQENVQSKEKLTQELRAQLKILQQALAHEENCRKLVEFQLTDAKAGMESVSLEFVAAQSVLESLRENSKKELAYLRDSLSAKDKLLKELQAQQTQIDQGQQELTETEVELQRYKSSHKNLQQAFRKHAEQNLLGKEIGVERVEKEMNLQEETEDLLRSLSDAEATIASKDVEVKELEMELDRARTLSELLRASMVDLEQKHLEEKNDVLHNLEQVNESLSSKEVRVKELEADLERLQVDLVDAHKCRVEVEEQITHMVDRLGEAQKEIQAKTKAIKESRLEERPTAFGSAHPGHKNNLDQALLDVRKHEEVIIAMRSENEGLQQLMSNHESERMELEKDHDKLLAELTEKEKLRHGEKQDWLMKFEQFEKQSTAKEMQLKELCDELERQQEVISTMEARCLTGEQQMAKQSMLAEQVHEELVTERLKAKIYKERAHVFEESLTGEAAAKGASLNEIKEYLHELTVFCKGGAEAATSQTLRISSIEEKLHQQQQLQGSIEERMLSLMGELNETVGEVERVTHGVDCLNVELQSLQEESKSAKGDFETRLRLLEEMFSTSCAELKEVTLQLGEMKAERVSLLKDLSMKAMDLDELRKENQNLDNERSKLESTAKDLEERILKLFVEAESNKAIAERLCSSLEVAEAGLVSRTGELHDLQDKLEKAGRMTVQLQKVEEKAQGLEDKLKQAEATVHDKEERLAASEWAVQQLASEIAKSKSYLAQKEKDEVVLREQLSNLDRQLRGKEREMVELQCDLDNAMKAGGMKQVVVQQLTCTNEELGHALDLTKRALEEKAFALSASEADVRRVMEMQRLMEVALETLKERLANETKASLAREREMEHLCQDMEKSKQEASMAEMQVKELQERLQHLERSTEARLESCERKMEKGTADLVQYKENCAALLDLIGEKDTSLDELEVEVGLARKELAKQAMLIEHGTQELQFVRQQLQSKSEMHRDLKDELATADGRLKDLGMQKQELEKEIRGLKRSLASATKDLTFKSSEIEDQRSNIEQLEKLSSRQGAVHALKSKELQMTSIAVEERDNQLSKLQSALNVAHDDLRAAYEMVAMKKVEKQILGEKLSEMESQVVQSQRQISQMQNSLQLAQADLEAETERVWFHVAARNEIQTELDAWKEKGAEITASMKEEFERSFSKLQVELKEWKDKAEHEQTLNSELEKSMQAVQQAVVEWENIVVSVVDEGQMVKLEMESILQEVHEEFQGIKNDLVESKQMIALTGSDGRELKAELGSLIKASETELEARRKETVTAVVTYREEREQFETSLKQLEAVIKDLREELKSWEAKAAHLPDVESTLKEKYEVSLKEALSELNEWKHRAEEFASLNKTLEQFVLDFEAALMECKLDAASVAEVGRDVKSDLDNSFQNLLKEVEETKAEMLEMKEIAALEAEETRYIQLDLERSIRNLQAEVELWKEKAATATEEGFEMREQFDYLLKNLQGELKTWKQFEALAQDEGYFANRAASEVEFSPSEAELESEEKSVAAADMTGSIPEEPGICSSSGQDQAQAQNGWKERVAISVKEGRVLTDQFRASFKKVQGELGSRKQPPAVMKEEAIFAKQEYSGLEGLVQALQEEAVVIKAELADWKDKAASAAEETVSVKKELGRTITKLKAEVEGWKDRAAMSAGQGIVARRQLEDFAKQVKSLHKEVQEWKELATEIEEGSSKLQATIEDMKKENEALRADLMEWKQKAVVSAEEGKRLKLELESSVKDLQADLGRWKQIAASSSEEGRIQIEQLERYVKELHAEVEKWKKVAASAEEEGKSAKLELLDTLDKLEDELEVWSGESTTESGSVEWSALKEDELECSSQASDGVMVEWKQGASEAGMPLQSEAEEWKKRAVYAEKQERNLRQQLESTVKELQLEVEAWKKSAACIAEDGRLVRLELEKKKKEFHVEATVDERKRTTTELAELQAELKDWKVIAADAAEECTSLRVAYDNVMKEVHMELAQWKEKAETASAEKKSMKAALEKVVEELQREVNVWREKAEKAVEGLVENQDYSDAVNALEAELCLWKERAQEGESLQLQLQEERLQLTTSLTETQTELQRWKERAAAVTTAVESLQEELVNVIEEGTSEKQDISDSVTALQSKVRHWKAKAQEGELLQVQLKSLLTETQSELQEWKQKAAAVALATESLKEELDCVIEEGRLEKEELCNSISALEAGVWRERTPECKSLQKQLRSSQSELQEWKEKAVLTTKSLMEELDFTIEEGLLEKQEFCKSISALKASVLGWKEKAEESESLQLQLKSALIDTQKELRDWKERAAAVALATKSLKGEMDCTLEENRLEKQELCNSISGLEAEVREWKARAQEGVSVQLQLERAFSELEEKAAAAASDSQALKEELDCTIGESSSEIHQLCNLITGLEVELSEWKDKAQESNSLQQQLESSLTEAEEELLEWKDRAAAASKATKSLREELDLNVDESRSQRQELCESITALKEELSECKAKAEQVESLRLQLSTLTATQTELQEWKQKAVAVTLATEFLEEGLDSTTEGGRSQKQDLGNSISGLKAELREWRERAAESESFQQQLKSSLSEARVELQDWRERAAALALSTQSLKDELDSAIKTISALTTQLSSQKENEASLQQLNRQLATDLELVREEALARKEKMSQILSQLEGTHTSQKELQEKLHLASHRLLGDVEPSSASHNYKVEEEVSAMELNGKAFSVGADGIRDVVIGNTNMEIVLSLRAQHQGRQSEAQFVAATDLKADLSKLSVKNVAVDQLKQELLSLKSLLSKLEHVRGGDTQGSQAIDVVGDGDTGQVAEEAVSQVQLGQYVQLCASLLRKNEELQKQVNGLQRRNRGPQKQVESLHATVESHLQKKGRSRLNPAKFKVLADVDGNSPLVTSMDKVQFHCSPVTPDQGPNIRAGAHHL